jgi:pimeloyl-ACP methyl ester carboxylesterase
MRPLLAYAASLLFALPLAAQVLPAISTDPPVDKTAPAKMETMQIPSHGQLLNALLYEAAGAGQHPTVILLHGFPGNEKNLDLAQAIRRDGFNVLYFNYRGSWGTPGAFSFAHCMEDAEAAIDYLRDPANAKRLRVDPSTIVLIGHSMGGMVALYTAAHDPHVAAVGAISAADMAGAAQIPATATPAERATAKAALAKSLANEGMAPLAGCTPEGLAEEAMDHPEWSFAEDAKGLEKKPTLIVTSDDGLAKPAAKLATALGAAGNDELQYEHLATDHAYSDKRIALEVVVLQGLNYLKGR